MIQVDLKFISDSLEVTLATKNVTIVENSITLSVTDLTFQSSSLFNYHI